MSDWNLPASAKSIRTINPIRAIVDKVLAGAGGDRADGKERIPLSLGDPTAFGNLPPCDELIDGVVNAAQGKSNNGYVNACGAPAARQAIAKFYDVSEDDVVIGSGCSGVLELCLTAMLDEDTNILVPKPGFPLYQVIADSHGAGVKEYRLDPATGWECDLDDMEAQIDKGTRGILINNPSNPCGSVFSEEHLEKICLLAAKHKLPIIADEVYGGMVFGGKKYVSCATVSKKLGNVVPVISACGLAKQFLVPGWRVGWLTFHDTDCGAAKEIKAGVMRLAQVVLGATHLCQAAVPSVLCPEGESEKNKIAAFKKQLNETFEAQSSFTCEALQKCHGLRVVPSCGAMYVMVEILIDEFDGSFEDDVGFTGKLLEEENVFALPGSCFGAKNFFRVVYCAPTDMLGKAYERIGAFCDAHKKK